MKFIGYTSIICLSALCVAHDANAVNMTSQIQRLVREKQEKVSKLEECDGKRKGFMIAGISTIGLTAVGVGVNIAQASKSNKLTEQIEEKNLELEKQQAKVVEINSEIARRNAAQKRMACESDGTHVYVNGVCRDRVQYECEQLDRMWVNGECKDKPITQNTTTAPTQTNNDAAILGCIKEIEQNLSFGFDSGKMVLFTLDGYMIPGDKAIQISRNWDYNKFTIDDISGMRSSVSYTSQNGVQEHERDACETLNRLKNYLSTVDRSTLKHVEDLGVAEYLNQTRDNNAGAGNGNTPADQPVYYRSMDDLARALDEECRNSGGTGRNADGDCICPDKMTQTENKRQCTCLDPTATYNKQQGKCVPGTINVTPIAAKPLSSSGDGGLRSSSLAQSGTSQTSLTPVSAQPLAGSGDGGLRPSSLSQSGSAPNAYTPDWTILDDNQNSYGLTQERFCNSGGETGHVGGALMPAYRDERTLTLEIKNAAGYHYWCDKLGGNWGVNQTSYGREWFCNIDKSKCTQGSTPQQSNNTVNRDGHANTLLAESILEQECSSVEKQSMPLVFEYYCVGTTQRKCEKLKTAFEDAGLPAPDVEFKAKIEEQSWPSGTRTIKNVCVVNLI